MLEDSDIFQPNIIVLVAVLIYLAQVLLKEDQSNFKRLSLRFHPERLEQCSNEEEYEEDEDIAAAVDARKSAFAVVAEAFEVLSDPLKRAVYDQYGEEALKNGTVRAPDGCVPAYKFHGQPMKTYREFFGTENPYGDLLDNLRSPVPLEACPETRIIKKKDEPVMKQLPLTLDEVFYGGIKKMKIQRLVLVGDDCNNAIGENGKGASSSSSSSTVLQEKILSIPIMPGIPAGAKIVFTEEGDQGPTKIPADVIFITEDRPHQTFKREGSNLRMTVDIFLRDALNGTIVTVNTIDDRILRVPITSVISPDYVKTIPGEGLPLVEDPERHGDLIIDFKIEFPSYLSPASKTYVNKAFDPRDESDDEVLENGDDNQRVHRMVLDGKMYMRTHELSEMCRL